MVNYRELLRLKSLGHNITHIAEAIHSSRNTVRDVEKLAEKKGISWPLSDELTNQKIYELLYPERIATAKIYLEPDCALIHRELARKGVNLTLQLACAWDFVRKMPEQINSMIFERGKGLSEGQAQRISIARALLRNAPVLLMDEATSALDVETEKKVLQNILQRNPNRTIIITTHRSTVLPMCDRVYRVVDKQIKCLNEEKLDNLEKDLFLK